MRNTPPEYIPRTDGARDPVVVALDFETADRGTDSACALGMARVRDGRVEDTLYALIRPPRTRVYFTEIHGLTWAMLRDCPTFAQLWPRFSAFLEGADYLAAHNAGFDRSILYGCCRAAGVVPPATPFLCTVRGARQGLRLPRNRLNDVCAHLGIELDHHNAASDALAAARIYLHLRERGLPPEAMILRPTAARPNRHGRAKSEEPPCSSAARPASAGPRTAESAPAPRKKPD